MGQKNTKHGINNQVTANYRLAGYGLLLLLSLIAIWTMTKEVMFSSLGAILVDINLVYALMAFASFSISIFMAAAMYRVLAPKGLRYGRTVLIALAGAFAGKLLPAGAGGITLNFIYLQKNKYSSAEAASIVACNNIIGFLAHSLLLLSVILATGTALSYAGALQSRLIPVLSLTVAVAVTLYGLRHRLRQPLKRFGHQLGRLITTYRLQPWRIGLSVLAAMVMTLSFTFCLYFSARAMGTELPFVTALTVFTIAAAATGLAPTPSGVGAVEAAMIAGLIGFSITASTAIAIVVAYRLVSFWIPFAVGALALALARTRGYV